MKELHIFYCTIMIILVSCEKGIYDLDDYNSPKHNFQVFWEEFDHHYSYFIVRNIQWDEVYDTYYPKISENNTFNNLYNICGEIIQLIEDGHVDMFSTYGVISYTGWKDKDPLNLTIQYRKYIADIHQSGALIHGEIKGAMLGYVRIESFSGETEQFETIDDVLSLYSDKKGLIIDVRSNGGGADANALVVSGRFADKTRIYRKIRYRNGPEHSDFTPWYEAEYGPHDETGYKKQVVLLTNHECFSATEGFVLQMRVLPHVTVLGDTTAGGSANPMFRELPNGWSFRLSNWQVSTPNGELFEGIGLAPDIQVDITRSDSAKGVDTMIERAIEVLN